MGDLYSGDVVPGGPADVRELPDLTIRKVSVSSMDNNCYLLTCRVTGEQLLIDAADDARRLFALVLEGGERLDTIVTTHQHFDHHRALVDLVEATGARTAAGRKDAGGLPVKPDVLLEHADTLDVGRLQLEVVHLRGHTPGSVALVLRSVSGGSHVFTGDSLFPGGVGNTDSDTVRFASLLSDVEERLFAVLPDDAWVYPGHGKDTTIGAERPQLPQWRARGW